MPEDEQGLYEIEEATAEQVRPLRSRYLRPDHPEDAVVYQTDEDETARHFVARAADGGILAVGSLCFEDRQAGIPPFGHPGMRLRGLAVSGDARGRGIGAAMVAHLLECGRAAGIAEGWATAPIQNLPFFKKNRFRMMSSEFEVLGIGPHHVVARNL